MLTTRTRRAVPAAVLGLILGLLIGVSASSEASDLTVKAVKRIAAKIVTKKAKHLSVAHATTATTADAATTAGTSDRVKGLVFTLPSQLNATARDYVFPGLPAGTYLASYGLGANIPTGTALTCQFQPATGATAAPSYSLAANGFATSEGSSIVTVAGSFHLACSASVAWAVNPYYGATVSFVPVATGAPTAATSS